MTPLPDTKGSHAAWNELKLAWRTLEEIESGLREIRREATSDKGEAGSGLSLPACRLSPELQSKLLALETLCGIRLSMKRRIGRMLTRRLAGAAALGNEPAPVAYPIRDEG